MLSARPSVFSVFFWNTFFSFVLTGAAFSVYFQQSPGGCGDYPQNFEVLFQGMGIGGVFALIFLFVYSHISNAFIAQTFFLTAIRYFLALTLLNYGFAKVFDSQFPHLAANMDARFIELSPMRVAWAFFGYSRGYQEFLGWGEVIPGVLLLFKRTTLLGAILAFTVMLNVFLINIFFDVCVKLNSGIYAALSLYILLQETGRLWNFFFTNRITGPRVDYVIEKPRWLKITGRVMNYSALAYVIWMAADDAWSISYQRGQSHIAQTPVQGPWRSASVLEWKDNQWRIKNGADSLFVNRIFFDGFNGVIRSDFIRDRFRFSIDSTGNLLTINYTNGRNEWNFAPVKWKYEKPHADSLHLWVKWKRDSLMIKCALRKETLTRY
jgi:hypothetical protein